VRSFYYFLLHVLVICLGVIRWTKIVVQKGKMLQRMAETCSRK